LLSDWSPSVHREDAPRRPTKGIRIATLYRRNLLTSGTPCCTMATTRWVRISEALKRLGYDVDMIADGFGDISPYAPAVRCVPWSEFDWRRYDIIKTLFHRGFNALCEVGGHKHPLIISSLGSVVGDRDGIEGVHFFGTEREALYETQKRIHGHSRLVTVLTEPSRSLWESCFRGKTPPLLVPTGVDEVIPPPRRNPYRGFSERIAVYIGNIYTDTQREVNLMWQARLQGLGGLLKKKRIRLCFVGPGKVDRLGAGCVTCLGPVPNHRIWDYQYFAGAGIVLAQGPVQHNESSKIYYYLRAGLPVVSERPVPNNHVLEESGLGLIAAYGDDHEMADLIEEAVERNWDKETAVQSVLQNHAWERRAEVYARLIGEVAG
jgi:glycosyltransferase involved in cell wall biosynthesis